MSYFDKRGFLKRILSKGYIIGESLNSDKSGSWSGLNKGDDARSKVSNGSIGVNLVELVQNKEMIEPFRENHTMKGYSTEKNGVYNNSNWRESKMKQPSSVQRKYIPDPICMDTVLKNISLLEAEDFEDVADLFYKEENIQKKRISKLERKRNEGSPRIAKKSKSILKFYATDRRRRSRRSSNREDGYEGIEDKILEMQKLDKNLKTIDSMLIQLNKVYEHIESSVKAIVWRRYKSILKTQLKEFYEENNRDSPSSMTFNRDSSTDNNSERTSSTLEAYLVERESSRVVSESSLSTLVQANTNTKLPYSINGDGIELWRKDPYPRYRIINSRFIRLIIMAVTKETTKKNLKYKPIIERHMFRLLEQKVLEKHIIDSIEEDSSRVSHIRINIMNNARTTSSLSSESRDRMNDLESDENSSEANSSGKSNQSFNERAFEDNSDSSFESGNNNTSESSCKNETNETHRNEGISSRMIYRNPSSHSSSSGISGSSRTGSSRSRSSRNTIHMTNRMSSEMTKKIVKQISLYQSTHYFSNKKNQSQKNALKDESKEVEQDFNENNQFNNSTSNSSFMSESSIKSSETDSNSSTKDTETNSTTQKQQGKESKQFKLNGSGKLYILNQLNGVPSVKNIFSHTKSESESLEDDFNIPKYDEGLKKSCLYDGPVITNGEYILPAVNSNDFDTYDDVTRTNTEEKEDPYFLEAYKLLKEKKYEEAEEMLLKILPDPIGDILDIISIKRRTVQSSLKRVVKHRRQHSIEVKSPKRNNSSNLSHNPTRVSHQYQHKLPRIDELNVQLDESKIQKKDKFQFEYTQNRDRLNSIKIELEEENEDANTNSFKDSCTYELKLKQKNTFPMNPKECSYYVDVAQPFELQALSHFAVSDNNEFYKTVSNYINPSTRLDRKKKRRKGIRKYSEYAKNLKGTNQKVADSGIEKRKNKDEMIFENKDVIVKNTFVSHHASFHLYIFLLVEKKQFKEAFEVIELALKRNPLFVLGRFEKCEIHKMKRNNENLFEDNKKNFKYCYKAKDLAKCYRNFGFYFIEKHMMKVAVACLLKSLQYEIHKMTQNELMYIYVKEKKKLNEDTENSGENQQENDNIEPKRKRRKANEGLLSQGEASAVTLENTNQLNTDPVILVPEREFMLYLIHQVIDATKKANDSSSFDSSSVTERLQFNEQIDKWISETLTAHTIPIQPNSLFLDACQCMVLHTPISSTCHNTDELQHNFEKRIERSIEIYKLAFSISNEIRYAKGINNLQTLISL